MQKAFLLDDSPASLVNNIVRTSNVHKLKKLATTMVAIIDIIENKQKYIPSEDLLKIYEILKEYTMLMRWINKLSKKQLFWNFWSIRSKVKAMEEHAGYIARILKGATTEEKRWHMMEMLASLEADMKGEEDDSRKMSPTPEKDDAKDKEDDAKDEEDDLDLKEFVNTKTTIALSLAAALNHTDDAENKGLDAFEALFATEHIMQLMATPAPTPVVVQEIVHAEEQDSTQACEELYRTMVEETSISVQDVFRIVHELADSTDEAPYSPTDDGVSDVENA
ncbi:hypothetical protein EWM64_g3313 [Hericium alpestre]|uniref:Uncharacterized protein n=1 Tax=Hericium alpestre TaxID=135208 RepID=A0A4Z0A487_9AGAM|nr:hypothetical protein EWM64_g3313 [Hericium alpestre]